jgi:hypothetical protein
MKRFSAAPAFLLLLANLGMAAEPSRAVEAILTLPYETVLPGVPFDMTVTLKNLSSSPVTVGVEARLVVTMPDGTNVSRKLWEGLLQPFPLPMDRNWVELAPGETRVCYADWYRYPRNELHDPDFSGPGVYGLTLHLATAQQPDNYVGEVVTTTARLTRAVPPGGEDEALWEQMNAAMGGRWASDSLSNSKEGPAILRDILQVHSGSAYYPYALLLERQLDMRRIVTKDDIALALAAAERFPSSPAHSYLLVRAGEVASTLAAYALLLDKDEKTFFQYFTLAAQYFDKASKVTKVPAVRGVAEWGKRYAQTEMEHQRQRAAGTYGKINQ